MFENDLKGSHGSYSNAGRSSAQKYHMIVNKDKILNSKGATKTEDVFLSEEEEERMRNEYSSIKRIDIFDANNIQSNKKAKRSRKKKQYSTGPALLPKDARFNTSTKVQQSHFLYNPKMDYILKRTLTGPKWNTLQGRDKFINNSNVVQVEYHCSSSDPLSSIGKTFVSMNKQTQRGQFASTHDVRIRSEKSFTPIKPSKKKTIQSVKATKTNTEENTIHTDRHSYAYKSSQSEKGFKDQLNPIKSKSTIHRSKKSFNELHTSPSESGINSYSYTYNIKGPDFSRAISREHLNYLNRDKGTMSPYFIPNYSLVRERPLSMVTYDRSIHPEQKKKALREQSTEPIITHDVNKLLNNINNYSSPSVPNFNIMTSRPNENKTLPSFMQKAFDRNSLNSTTAKTLMMNNYSNSVTNSNYDTINKKKSFNAILNMNLLFSDQSAKVLKTESLNKEESIWNKKMGFYRMNLDDMAKVQHLSRFDGITFKSIPRKYKMEKSEEKRIMLNFN